MWRRARRADDDIPLPTGEATRKRDETAWLLHINLLEKEKDLLSSVSGLQIRHADFTILLIRCIVAG